MIFGSGTPPVHQAIRPSSPERPPLTPILGANIPGLANPNQRSLDTLPWDINKRQTSTTTVSLATLLAQQTLCIPPSVDVSPIVTSVKKAQSDGRVHAQGVFGFIKDLWKDVKDVFAIIKDVEALITWYVRFLSCWCLITRFLAVMYANRSGHGQL